MFDSRWRTVLTPCPGSSQTILASLGRPKRHHPTFSPVFRPVARRSAPIAFYPNSDGRRRLAPPGLLSSWSIPLPTAHPAKFGSSHSPSPRPTSSLPRLLLDSALDDPSPSPEQAIGRGLIPFSEVQKHDSPDDCWVIVSGKVYDLTEVSLTCQLSRSYPIPCLEPEYR